MGGMLGALVGSFAPAGGSFESIATATGTGSSDTITFSSIPSTYKHLQIRGIANDTAGFEASLVLNGDTAGNYVYHRLLGNGSTASATGSVGDSWIRIGNSGSTADTFATYIIDIQDYTSTTRNKTTRTFTGRDLNGSGSASLYSGLWLSTSAVTSVSIVNVGARSWTSTTTFALYGIKG